LVRRLPGKTRLVDAACALQVVFCNADVFARDLNVSVVLERESYRLTDGDRALVSHINPDAAKIGQYPLVRFKARCDRRNIFQFLSGTPLAVSIDRCRGGCRVLSKDTRHRTGAYKNY